jgi:hypothetical protein
LGDDPDNGFEKPKHEGHRPVIFDVVKADRRTSLLPKGIRLVMHVNPRTMSLSYAKQTDRMQTRGGFVEFHWGDAAEQITFEAATGGFMRLYTGLSNIAGGTGKQGRRETIAYDKYLDLLALFHNNGSIYDALGNIVVQGYIKMTFDGGVHIGWFDGNFVVTESAMTPYMFSLSATFTIDQEILRWRSSNLGIRDDRIGQEATSLFDTQALAQEISADDALAADIATGILDPEIDPVHSDLIDPFATAEREFKERFEALRPVGPSGLRDPFEGI